jgi:hypothetical protein
VRQLTCAAIALSALGLVVASGAGAATSAAEGGLVVEASKALADYPEPLPEKHPPGWVAIETVSNGCGPGKADAEPGVINSVTDSSTFFDPLHPLQPRYEVNFRDACNLHDAAFSGALVWDKINGKFIDYRTWTKTEIAAKFAADMERLCEAHIPDQHARTLEICKGGLGRYLIGGAGGVFNYRTRIDLTGTWKNAANSWPLCDTGVGEWTMTQTGRTVTADWQHGTSGKFGHFEGVFITGDRLGDDRVQGTYTITFGKGGAKESGGAMGWSVVSEDKFDFNGAALPGGTILRTTQGVPARHVCRKPTPTSKTTTTSQAGSFVLTSTKVTNPNAPELTIDAAGGKAVWDHTGPYGGAGKGGEWKVTYTWQVPRTLTPGKSASVTLSLKADSVEPSQPLLVQMSARAPDFRQDLSINYPSPAQAAKTYTMPLSAGYKDFKDLVVIVSVVSAEVTYTYHRVGA